MNRKAATHNRSSIQGLLPRVAVLELTYRCNHECIFCSCPWFATESRFEQLPELEINDWRTIISQIVEAGVEQLAFTGGEPLLKSTWQEIVAHAATTKVGGEDGHAPRLYLLSNGRLMSREVLEVCMQHKIVLSMSLPGLRTFREHTRAGEPENVLKWFGEARCLGVHTIAGITVTKRNIDELYETMAEALLAGAQQILLNRFLPGGRGLGFAEELALSDADIRGMLTTAETVLSTAGRYGHVGTELPACVAGDTSGFKHLQVGNRCAAAVEFFVIDPSGYVRVCNHSPKRLTHFSHLKRLADNPYWRQFVNRAYLPAQCRACELASACDAGCREAAHITCGSPKARERGLQYELQKQSVSHARLGNEEGTECEAPPSQTRTEQQTGVEVVLSEDRSEDASTAEVLADGYIIPRHRQSVLASTLGLLPDKSLRSVKRNG